MKSYHYKKVAMAPNSENLLRVDQNMCTPKIDILVRESVQNSLDACDGDRVRVDYTLGSFDDERLSETFPELASVFRDCPGEFICIRDTGTVGLGGPVKLSEVGDNNPGNYISLVKGMMDTSKKDTNAGGSWGIGKVIYYKIGINFVIYYSRVRHGDGHQSRMSAVWMDDGSHRFVPENLRKSVWRGISLWGTVVQDDIIGDMDVIPVTDETPEGREEIASVLDSFGLSPFDDDDTGTMIIIPGLNRQFLLNEIRDDDGLGRRWWTSNLVEYLWFSIQRWFSPRLTYTGSGNPVLIPSINGEVKMDVMPLFQKFQMLYRSTFDDFPGVKRKDVNLNYKKGDMQSTYRAGILSWALIPRSDLVVGSSFDNPYELCGIEKDGKDGNKAIAVYTRSLGMFVTYDDPALTRQLPEVGDDAYLLAVFRLDPDTKYPTPIEGIETIENYVRAGEKSDHFIWTDQHSYNQKTLGTNDILKRTFGNIARILKEDVSSSENAELKGKRTTVGRKIAESLFPPGGHFVSNGRRGQEGPGTGGGHGGGRKPRTAELSNFTYEPVSEGVSLNMDIDLNDRNKTEIELSVSAPTTRKSVINRESWEQEFGTPFPFDVIRIRATELSRGSDPDGDTALLTPDDKSVTVGKVTLKWRNPSKITVTGSKKNIRLHLEMMISRPENGMSPVISVDSGDEE